MSAGRHARADVPDGRLGDREAVALLTEAVAIPSPSGSEGEVARYLARALERSFDLSGVDEVGNVVATIGRGPRTVTLLGHVDTAPGSWGARCEDGVVHGRGSVDAKGAVCAMAVAASRLSARARRALRVRLIGAVEEEAPGSRGARFALEAYERPDLVVIGEPSGWDAITLGYKGRLTVEVRARRPSGHSARDEPTAAAAVADAWTATRAWAEDRSKAASGAFHAVQANLAEIGSSDDGLEQRAWGTIGVRLPVGLAPEAAAAEVEACLERAGLARGHALEVVASGFETAYRGPRDTELTRAFRTAIRSVGGTPRTVVKTGTSDMNVVAPVWDVPMLAYGPGDSALDHTPDEHLPIEEYLRAIEVVRLALERLAGRGSGADAASLGG